MEVNPERSVVLEEVERRVQIEARVYSRSAKSEFGNRVGQVDNEDKNQSRYSNISNTYMKMRVYTRKKAQQYWQEQRCGVSDIEDVRVMMWGKIT